MELDDCAFPLLADVVCTDDADVAFGDADVALLVGAMPRKAGMERSDLLSANGGIFKPQGEALSDSAKKDVKILVVGNPANTNALIAMQQRPRPRPAAVHGDDPPRPQPGDQPAGHEDVGTTVNDITNMTIWGNHSATQYPDLFHAEVDRQERLRAGRRPRLGRRHLHPDRGQARRGDHRGPRRVVGGVGGQRRDRPHPLVGARHAPTATGCRWPFRPTAPTAWPRA